MSTRAPFAIALCAALSACAGSGPDAREPVVIAGTMCSGLGELSQALGSGTTSEAAAAKPPDARPGLAAVIAERAGGGHELLLVELASARVRWQKPLSAASKPQILADVVLTTTTDHQLLAFDLETGAERFAIPLSRPLWLGADQSGQRIVFSVGSASWDPRARGSSLIAVDSRTGQTLWQRDQPYALGRPLVLGANVLAVSDHADVWAARLTDGRDSGCARIGGNTIEWLTADHDAIRFGAVEARALGSDGREIKPALELPRRDLPGRPLIAVSSYQPVPATRSAHGRVALIAPLRSGAGAPGLLDERFYYIFFRHVFGFRADGSLAWVRTLDDDVVQARAIDLGLLIMTEGGAIEVFDGATGEGRASERLARRVTSADLALSRWPGPRLDSAAPELQSGLVALARDTDARLLPARLLAIDELARLDAASATEDLLDIYRTPNLPQGLRDRIEKRMRERTQGLSALLAALSQHEDFLEDRRGPPLRAIVPALTANGETRAVPGLIEQLFDPDTPVRDLSLLVSALDRLGGDEVREPLLRFFRMYHADSALADDPTALGLAAEALRARDQPEVREALARAAANDNTLPELRASLQSAQSPVLEPAASAAPGQAPAPSQAAPRRSLAQLRAALTTDSEFSACIEAAHARAPKQLSVRLWFVARSDGTLEDLQSSPPDRELIACLQARFDGLRVDTGRSDAHQLVSQRVLLQPPAAKPAPSDLASQPTTFWSLAAERTPKDARIPESAPWWQDQNPLFLAIDAPAARATPQVAARDAAPPRAPAKLDVEAERATGNASPPARSARPEAGASPSPTKTPGAASAPEPEQPADAWWVPEQRP